MAEKRILYTVVNRSGINIYEDHSTKSKKVAHVIRAAELTGTQWYGKWIYFPSQKGWGAASCVIEGNRGNALVYELKLIAKKMIAKNFRYSTKSLPLTLSAALKSDHRTDCAHFVSYGLQALGLLPSGKYIWLNKKINGNGANYVRTSGKYYIGYPNKYPKDMNLKVGDICGWGYTINGVTGQHTQVYAGKDSKGNYLWMSGGTSDVNGKNYGEKQKPSYMKRKVNVWMRLK